MMSAIQCLKATALLLLVVAGGLVAGQPPFRYSVMTDSNSVLMGQQSTNFLYTNRVWVIDAINPFLISTMPETNVASVGDYMLLHVPWTNRLYKIAVADLLAGCAPGVGDSLLLEDGSTLDLE